VDAAGREKPRRLVITSPNATWIPNVQQDQVDVRARRDGTFYTADFSLMPQWFFKGTYYFPFVRRKPAADILKDHPFSLAWYKVHRGDFVHEEGSIRRDFGRLREDLVEEITLLRKDLADKVTRLVDEGRYKEHEYDDLLYCRLGMLYTSVALTYAPLTFDQTLLTVTTFQRYFLETLACYEYLTIWKERMRTLGDVARPVDDSVMGAIVCRDEDAMRLFLLGVEVWFVRPLSRIQKGIKIGSECTLTIPDGLVKEYMALDPVSKTDACADRNRACQQTGCGTIGLGVRHSSYTQGSLEYTTNFDSTPAGRHYFFILRLSKNKLR
jgi:hypothetical protein